MFSNKYLTLLVLILLAGGMDSIPTDSLQLNSISTVSKITKTETLFVFQKSNNISKSPYSNLTYYNYLNNKKLQIENLLLESADINVTVQVGHNAYLPCNVERLVKKPVSWIRVRDGHIITVDQTLFIADERFQAIYNEPEQKWSLLIKYSQVHDMGLYECQVSSEPKTSFRVFLNIAVPKTELIGEQNRFVKPGSKVALHCIIRGSIEAPSYILWYRGNNQIVEGNKYGWKMEIDREIFGNNSDQQDTIGSLIIPFVTKYDSGNYTCSPSNSPPITIDLHVLNGEYSASAIISSAIINRQKLPISLLLLLLSVLRFA